MTKRIVKAEFVKWLRSKRPDEVVGRACAPWLCPLARFTGRCIQGMDFAVRL